MEIRKALVRRPSPRLFDGLLTHIERSEVDMDLAERQWEGYVKALQDAGWETIEVPAIPECPDSVFIEDPVVVYGKIAVIARSGAEERRPEAIAVEEVVRDLGYEVHRIEAPGTLDGGDVLKFGGKVWVGEGGRTNTEGIRQLAEILKPEGAEVIGVPTTKALHLKSAVTALPDGTVIGWEPVVDDPSTWDEFLAMPEEPGSHVVILGEKTLLISAAAPRSIALLEERGYEVIPVDVTEYEKLEGCVTCLSVRLRGCPTA